MPLPTSDLRRELQAGAEAIEVRGEMSGTPMISSTLGCGCVAGRFGSAPWGAADRDNVLEDVTIRTADHETALLNDTSVADLGTLTLRNVRTSGQVLLVARDAVRAGHVRVEGLAASGDDEGANGQHHRT